MKKIKVRKKLAQFSTVYYVLFIKKRDVKCKYIRLNSVPPDAIIYLVGLPDAAIATSGKASNFLG